VKINTVLENLIGFFAKEKIDFALIGAFALQAYGYVRATGDIDFVLRGEDRKARSGSLNRLGMKPCIAQKGFQIMFIRSQFLAGLISYTWKAKPLKKYSPALSL